MRMLDHRDQIQDQTHYRGHAHFGPRARLSRRRFLWTTTATAAAEFIPTSHVAPPETLL
jgi:hypothetical protein